MKKNHDAALGITLEALSVIDAIDRRGSFALAADELGRVPSALSYIIQKLEEQLDVTLFQKQGRKSVLTPAGKHLLEEGRKLLGAANVLKEQTQSIASGWEPRLRIAFDSMFDAGAAFNVIETFLQAHDNIEIDVQEQVLNGAWEALIEDEVDLLLGSAGPVPQHKGIRAIPLGHVERVFAVSPRHPLAKAQQPISSEELSRHRAIVVHDTARNSVAWSKGLGNQRKCLYVPTVEYKIAAQLTGAGCGYLPHKRIQSYLERGELIALDLEAPPAGDNAEVYMAWKIVNKGQGLKTLRELFLANQTLFNSSGL